MAKGQSKSHSMAEAWVNILVGFFINLIANLTILPWFGFDLHFHQAFEIGLIFTVISVIRSYYMRRVFNYFTHDSAERTA
jgi:hypothetical protein